MVLDYLDIAICSYSHTITATIEQIHIKVNIDRPLQITSKPVVLKIIIIAIPIRTIAKLPHCIL